jgi:N-acetylglutamate synthase-like GNAT family acetyltransferase
MKKERESVVSKPINRIITGQYPTVGMRRAKLVDIPALETLIEQSFRAAAEGHYTGRQIESALQSVARVDSELIENGTLYIAHSGGDIVGAGGWSGRRGRYRGDLEAATAGETVDAAATPAHLRSFYVGPHWTRMGVGAMLAEDSLKAARQAGFTRAEVLATPMSLPFFTALGFVNQGETEIPLPDGVRLPVTRLSKPLA